MKDTKSQKYINALQIYISELEGKVEQQAEKLKNSITWEIADFEMRAQEIEEEEGVKKGSLYDRSLFKKTLKRMIIQYDAEYGISWDTVDSYLEECKIAQKKKEEMKTIRYKGKGEHSVRELEAIIEQQAEQIHLFNSGETFESWHETHFEIVQRLFHMEVIGGNRVSEVVQEQGTGGLYQLAKDLTDKFETLYGGVVWGVDEDIQYFDKLEDFLDGELK